MNSYQVLFVISRVFKNPFLDQLCQYLGHNCRFLSLAKPEKTKLAKWFVLTFVREETKFMLNLPITITEK